MEKPSEQTANVTTPGSEPARFSVPKLSVPTLSHPRISSAKSETAPSATPKKAAAPTKPKVVEAEVPPTPVKSTPVKSAPTEAASTKSASSKSAQTKSATTKSLPVKTTLVKTSLVKSALVKTALATMALVKTKPQTKVLAPVVVAKKRTRGKSETVLLVKGLTKRFDETVAVDGVDLEVKSGSFYGIVGPNGAGKTTTLSMITGLLRPDAGTVAVNGADVWTDPVVAKRNMGVLPDRLRLFDRLTGAQLLYYAGVLRGMDSHTVRDRSADLANAFGLEAALGRLVSDYSAGMTKKIALAAAMIHAPRLLVLDEPFESVDPVSAATVTEILKKYASEGGTVVLSSHSMDLVQRICDNVAVIVGGSILADGTMAEVRNGESLEDRFVELAGGRKTVEGLEWLHSFSD